MELVFDIETDDLNATEIHCIVAIDENNKQYTFDIIDDNILKGLDFLAEADKLIGHNVIGFDIPVIKKLHGIDLWGTNKVIDTLWMKIYLNTLI